MSKMGAGDSFAAVALPPSHGKRGGCIVTPPQNQGKAKNLRTVLSFAFHCKRSFP